MGNKSSSFFVGVTAALQSLRQEDVHLVHVYAEGIDMTIADICLFSYFLVLLVSMVSDIYSYLTCVCISCRFVFNYKRCFSILVVVV